MLPVLNRRPTPEWLISLGNVNDPLPITEVLQGSVFYPASAMDGRPVQYLAGFSHSFVYTDWYTSQKSLEGDLDTFRGYRVVGSRQVTKEELCFRPFQPILPEPTDEGRFLIGTLPATEEELHFKSLRPILPNHSVRYSYRPNPETDLYPFALWAIYERHDGYTDEHGPERFSLLFIGGEGAATFQSLYYSNQCAPSVIALIKCAGHWGDWHSFYESKGVFARSVMQNQYGTPDYIFCDGSVSPPEFRQQAKSVWPGYSKLECSVAFRTGAEGLRRWLRAGQWEGQLQLWGRGPGERVTS